MANRHLLRSITLQVLYQWDIKGYQNGVMKKYLDETIQYFSDIEDFDSSETVLLLENIAKKRVLIDDIIQKAAPLWTLDKIAVINRSILRLGLYELLFGDKNVVPPKVAINEAIKLSKKYGGAKAHKFVNGVIGAVYKEIGEPGKDQETKSKIPKVPYEEMPIDQKGAAVVYSTDDQGVIRLGMVHDVFGYWTLSKGGIEENETLEQGTVREVKEETGWEVGLGDHLGENEYVAYHPTRGPVRKQVNYFLAKSDYTQPTLEVGTGGLDDVRWFELGEVSDLNMYDDVSKMLVKAIEKIVLQASPDEDESPALEGEETESEE